MNTVQSYLSINHMRLRLDRFGNPARWTCVVKTPRFRASRHVVWLILDRKSGEPLLVSKVPRIAADRSSVEQEAANLAALKMRPTGCDGSVPRLIALEDFHGYPILSETAVAGKPMSPSAVKQDRAGCCRAATDWLVQMHRPVAGDVPVYPDWLKKQVDQPLSALERALCRSREDAQLVEATREIVQPLSGARIQRVIEHGDFSHPNLFRRADGGIGVVDWELARIDGLPACDLFFFLTYAAAACRGARTTAELVSAHRGAFSSPDAWTGSFVSQYANSTAVPSEAVYPLLVLTWVRSLARFLDRLSNANVRAASSAGAADASASASRRFDVGPSDGSASPAVAEWLRSHRYFALWRDTVERRDNFSW